MSDDPRLRVAHTAGVLPGPAPVYYECLDPVDVPPDLRVLLVHGGAMTGSCYLTTPDGRPGWAHRLLSQGLGVVVADWPGVGRSGAVPEQDLRGDLVCAGLGALLEALPGRTALLVHSMSGPFGFRLVESHGPLIHALVAIAPGPPGNIQPEPVVTTESDGFVELDGISRRWRIPKSGEWHPDETLVLTKMIGSSTRFPMGSLERFRASLVPVPSRLLYERQNIRGSQLTIEDYEEFSGKPILVLTGSADSEHPRELDGATAAWLASIGADVEFRFLDDPAMAGNGHCPMLEDNSDEIADEIASWLRTRLSPVAGTTTPRSRPSGRLRG